MDLSERAWQIVQLARTEAHRLGDPHVGTDHLLLAMLGDGGGAAALVLDEMGVGYDDVRERIVESDVSSADTARSS